MRLNYVNGQTFIKYEILKMYQKTKKRINNINLEG